MWVVALCAVPWMWLDTHVHGCHFEESWGEKLISGVRFGLGHSWEELGLFGFFEKRIFFDGRFLRMSSYFWPCLKNALSVAWRKSLVANNSKSRTCLNFP